MNENVEKKEETVYGAIYAFLKRHHSINELTHSGH